MNRKMKCNVTLLRLLQFVTVVVGFSFVACAFGSTSSSVQKCIRYAPRTAGCYNYICRDIRINSKQQKQRWNDFVSMLEHWYMKRKNLPVQERSNFFQVPFVLMVRGGDSYNDDNYARRSQQQHQQQQTPRIYPNEKNLYNPPHASKSSNEDFALPLDNGTPAWLWAEENSTDIHDDPLLHMDEQREQQNRIPQLRHEQLQQMHSQHVHSQQINPQQIHSQQSFQDHQQPQQPQQQQQQQLHNYHTQQQPYQRGLQQNPSQPGTMPLVHYQQQSGGSGGTQHPQQVMSSSTSSDAFQPPPPQLPNGQYGGGDFGDDEDEEDLMMMMTEEVQTSTTNTNILPNSLWGSSNTASVTTTSTNVQSMPFYDRDRATNNAAATVAAADISAFNKEFILKGLARLYRRKLLPLELASKYGHFHSPPLSPSDFDAPPMILLLGQYSVGKTSFVKYLLGRDFPGIRVGPEPTTDRFNAILLGSQDKIIPGAALCSQTDRPFTGLNLFGNNFLSRMEGVELNAPILRNVTIIDTPGILSGQKQKSRNYDYEAVMKWFAERSDLIIVMFDAHKLDISDELKSVMQLMIPHLDKIRIVLNKADTVSTQQLLRVYGALMWSLGKVMNTPEVSRVYVGSFWDAPLMNTEQVELLQREELDLLQDIMALPQHAVMRRINELVKRARSVKVHAYIIHYLRKQLPYNPWMRRDKQKQLIRRLDVEFTAAARRYGLPKGDFPALEPMRQALMEIKDLSEFPKLDKKLVREMDRIFTVDIPELLERAKKN